MSQQTDSSGSQMSDEASSDPSIIIQSEDLDGEQVRHQYLIEEEIEEITEEFENENVTSSSRSVTKSGPWISSAPSMHSVDCILAELNSDQVDKKNTVPFPEFGVDIILHHRENSDFSTETSSSSSEDDEENGGPKEIPKEVNEALLCHQSIEDR